MTYSRGVEALVSIVRSALGHLVAGPVDLLALYPGRVVAQSADKTRVDVQLDTDRIPSPSNIPLRLGIPGASVTLNLAGNVRVLVGWEGGDSTKPYAQLFEPSAATLNLNLSATTQVAINGGVLLKLDGTLVKLNNGTLPIARQTDTAGPYPITGGNPTVLG